MEHPAFPGYDPPLSAFRDIPPELLSDIFSYVCLENSIYSQLYIPGLTLSRVSPTWRNVAFATAQLWSAIRIKDWPAWKDPGWATERLELLKFLLKRSGNYPLSLTILSQNDFRGSELPMAGAMQLFAIHSCRWQYLSIHCNFPNVAARLERSLASIQGHLPNLHALTYSPMEWVEPIGSILTGQFFVGG
ncbi:hypothetical protein C8J56DRAFT_286863 [Mycena floridula]|nr:hypothetical protein C8J56DRAFT_286863 [Mycena floridula]